MQHSQFRRNVLLVGAGYPVAIAPFMFLVVWSKLADNFLVTIASFIPLYLVAFVIYPKLFLRKEWAKNKFRFDSSGFTYSELNKEPQTVQWAEIKTIYRTKHSGNSLVMITADGREFWLNTNKDIEDEMCRLDSSLAALIPAKDDVRKWQEWDIKL